jgi:hypothetical protein
LRFSPCPSAPRGAFLSLLGPRNLHWLLAGLVAVAGAAALGPASAGRADTISQTTAVGKIQILQRDAIVVKQNSEGLTYKHFDLKERRVVKVTLSEMSLPYHIQTSSGSERQSIVALWKKFGYAAVVTDFAGATTKVYDAYLDFYPPGGRGSLLESLPPRTSFPLVMAGGSADDAEFEKILSVEFNGPHLKITLRDATVEEGQFLTPTNRPVEVRFLGITDRYDPSSQEVFDFALPLPKIRKIEFER